MIDCISFFTPKFVIGVSSFKVQCMHSFLYRGRGLVGYWTFIGIHVSTTQYMADLTPLLTENFLISTVNGPQPSSSANAFGSLFAKRKPNHKGLRFT